MLTRDAKEQFLAICRAADLSLNTIKFYTLKIELLEAREPELPTTPGPIIALMGSLTCRSGYSKDAFYRAYRAFYNVISPWYGIPNPMPLVRHPRPKPTVMRTCSLSELGVLLSACRKPLEKGVVTLFIDTGLRPGEMASLDWSNVRADHIVVRGKTGQREIPVGVRTIVALIECSPAKQGPVFVGERGPLTAIGIYQLVRRVASRAGVDLHRACPLGLRHSFGRQYTMNGGDVFSLQRIMGHNRIETTRKYIDLDTADVARQHRRYSPLAALPASFQGNLFDLDNLSPALEKGKSG